MVISDTASSKDEKREFLTTAWTEIGGSQLDDTGTRGDLEGFGITNVDIEIKGSYIPRVVVDFVDIRGATLFEQGSCSPYGLFFHMPYPTFELTLKGYYGKPVTYYLNLQKFNTKFNTETGNFEAKAEFIGWSYAFLADMLMGYIRCSNYMDGQWKAQPKLKQKYDETIKYYIDNGIYDETDYLLVNNEEIDYVDGTPDTIQPFCRKRAGTAIIRCKTISDLLADIEIVKDFLAAAKTDDSYLELSNLIKVRNNVVKVRSEVVRFAKKLLDDDYKNYLTPESPLLTNARNVVIEDDGTRTTEQRNVKELYVFNSAPDDTLYQLLKQFWKRPFKDSSSNDDPPDNEESSFAQITSLIPITKKDPVSDTACGGTYVKVASQKNINGGLTGCKDLEEPNDGRYEMFDFLDVRAFQNGVLNKTSEGLNYTNNTNTQGNQYYIDLGFINVLLDEDLQNIDIEIDRLRNFVKESIDAGILKRLGFRPTIRNVFTILACNTENFMGLLLDTCIAAEEQHNGSNIKEDINSKYTDGERRLLELKNSGDTIKHIYPWPTYYRREYQNTATYASNTKPQTKEVYPGENPEFFNWPEVRFVEDFIEACNKLNKADEALVEDKTGLPGFDNYTPINPLESKLYDDIQCKYRNVESGLTDAFDTEQEALKYIAERMFVSLDFSYFDPVRYNPFNIGMGFSSSYLSATSFDKDRMWFPTLYPNPGTIDDGYSPIETIARIDAHNLLSCITDTDILNNLNIFIGSGPLMDTIETELKTITDGDEPDGDKSWFTTEANYTDLYPSSEAPQNMLETNLPNVRGFNTGTKYWAYQPAGGFINFVGRGSDQGQGVYADENTALRIYSDIRKMKPKYLFKLIEDENIGNSNTVSIEYTGIHKERKEELNEFLVKGINTIAGDFAATSKEMVNYITDDEYKILQFVGTKEKVDGLRLFTTLGVGLHKYDGSGDYDDFNIDKFGLAVYPSNDDNLRASSLMAGYGTSVASMVWPFAQQTYMFNGDSTSSVNKGPFNDMIGSGTDSILFLYAHAPENIGRGIFKGVKIYDNNGENSWQYTDGRSAETVENFTYRQQYVVHGVNEDIGEKWGGIQVVDNLIQLPIWLDNVNRFRKAASIGGNLNTTLSSVSNRVISQSWGNGRPLTNTPSDTNYHELKAPKLEKIITTYGGTQNNQEYTTDQIERRNLGYLFLAACKTTPFITCGTSVSNPQDINSGAFSREDEGTHQFKEEHYPKALRPFIVSQGVIKLPKLWVYGIGSVLWRWKMWMGADKDEKGNILWRNPAFGQEPIGLDPLSQPGHPSVACDSSGTLQGTNGLNWTGRRNRSTTRDNQSVTNANESFANTIFYTEKSGLWSSPIDTENTVQISCFSQTTARISGLGRAVNAGRVSGNEYENIGGVTTPKIVDSTNDGEYTDAVLFGCAFDYWGVYNNDLNLSKKSPNSQKYFWDSDSYWTQKRFSGCWTNWYRRFVWTKNACDFYIPFVGNVGTPADEYEPLFAGDNSLITYYGAPPTFECDEFDEQKGGPLELQMRSAKEASSNSYWPLLWVAPWQHFYTEPVNILGSKGQRQDVGISDVELNSGVEQTITFIPYDHPFRDYVGNFGYLGNVNNNYTSRFAYNITQNDFTNPESFTRITMGGSVDLNPNIGLMACFYTDGTTLTTAEGGKYNELIALLPTFVKERFVEEFERWCDLEWKSKLEIIDPVNFSSGSIDLLGRSYRMKPFLGKITAAPLAGIIGDASWEALTDPPNVDGDTTGLGWTALANGGSESDGKSQNADVINGFQKQLIEEYYYAVITTPRVFGLDVYNGDKSEGGNRNAFYANKDLVKKYIDAFQLEWNDKQPERLQELSDDDIDDAGSILNDDDIKLSLYRSFKSICDKWISSSKKVKDATPSYFFNITDNNVINKSSGSDKVPLAGHFSYVNRVMQEIGNKAVLDIIKLDKIRENPKMSLYNLISDLLGENKFDFFPLPTFTNFTSDKSDEKLKAMFKPDTNTIRKAGGPNFICMYVGGTSRMLDMRPKGINCPIDAQEMNYTDDGFSLPVEENQPTPEIPYEMMDSEEPLISSNKFNYKDDNRIEGKGFTAFRVAYGIENQNMFKSVELDQSEFSETNESLLVIDRLANGGNPADKTNKGNNLHNLYLTRSYTCSVESMGNMMIQPLQYFQLTNIPMFYGTYLITEVKHNVKPHYIGTTFKGVRQPIATVPLVEDVATAMNLSMRDVDPNPNAENVLFGGAGSGGGSGGGSSTSSGTPVAIGDIEFNDFGPDYLNKNTGANFRQDVDTIVLHWTAGNTFNDPSDSGTALKVLKSKGLGYHLIVDENGGLNQTGDLTRRIGHAGCACGSDGRGKCYGVDGSQGNGRSRGKNGVNFHSIGVSYVGGVEQDNTSQYIRTVPEWNYDTWDAPNGHTFKPKEQFVALIKACIIAKRQHPTITKITSHHWITTRKGDVGNSFPWDILLNTLREIEPSFNDVEIFFDYDNDCPTSGGKVRSGTGITPVSGDIDLSVEDALDRELSGNASDGSNLSGQYNNTQPIGTGIQGTNISSTGSVQNALQSAGQI